MKVIVGLGNPGKEYEKTKHNLGFMVLDSFAKRNLFPEFKSSKKFKSQISRNSFEKKRIVLAKPQTFMNNSGKAVKLLIKPYAKSCQNLILVHDDIDLELGKIKIVKNRGTAGHKGIESIIKELKTKDFVRFRIGIKPNRKITGDIKNFVLKNFTKKEKEVIKKSVKQCVQALETTLTKGLEKAMNEYN
jgi:PTH1 family peptidyl-tRNA hydrolase